MQKKLGGKGGGLQEPDISGHITEVHILLALAEWEAMRRKQW